MVRYRATVQHLTGETVTTTTSNNNGVEQRVANFSSLGTLSVATKHWAAFFDTLYHGYQNVLVVEDDVVFARSLNLEKVLQSLPAHWSNCYLGDFWDTPCDEAIAGFRLLNPFRICRQPRGTGSNGMVAYLLSHEGACRLMHHLPLTIDPDHHANALSRADPRFTTFRTVNQFVRETKKLLGKQSWRGSATRG